MVRLKRRRCIIFACLLGALLSFTAKVNSSTPAGITLDLKVQEDEFYDKLPLYFIQNNGQTDNTVRFYEKGDDHATYFTKDGVYLALSRGQDCRGESRIRPCFQVDYKEGDHKDRPYPGTLEPWNPPDILKLSFVGGNKEVEIIGEGLLDGKVNYLTGNDPERWKTGIPTYDAVVYKEVYPGIDIKFYGNNDELEYDIMVKPGADPNKVRLSYEGIEGLNITKEGDLEIDLTPLKSPLNKGGERGVTSTARREEEKIIQKRPYVYQQIDGKRVEMEGKFKLFNPKSPAPSPQPPAPAFIYGFDVASYDKRYPLIIDPVLVYSTYLGGSNNDLGNSVAVDPSGNIYVTGVACSTNFPTKNVLQQTSGGTCDAFVSKLNPTGSAFIYSTYLGGRKQDRGHAIAIDSSGNAYIAGVTNSPDFPTANPLQPTFGGIYDAFVSKLDPTGSNLIYSTYLGGSNRDGGLGIAVGLTGSVFITGETASTNFPTINPLQSTFGGSFSDAFVAKFDPAGSALIYSTYLGGSYPDSGFAIAVDPSGNVYVTGDTRSANFPTANQLQPIHGGMYDIFVTKLNPRGTLIYSTFLGGKNDDEAYAIAVDLSGNAYVTGETRSANFPIVNPLQSVLGGFNDVFVAKFNPSGSALVYSTYLGGSGFDQGSSIAIDSSGNAYVTGQTNSANFPTANPLQSTFGGRLDAFVVKLNQAGFTLIYSTYLGGSDLDRGHSIAIDSSGNAYITGMTDSINFPTKNPLQATSGRNSDAFLVKIIDNPLKGKKVK